jgi:hypothetical protein
VRDYEAFVDLIDNMAGAGPLNRKRRSAGKALRAIRKRLGL